MKEGSLFRGAQRLSASQRDSRYLLLPEDKPRHVLNAFRHHREIHNFPVDLQIREFPVLNAFRHHREIHGDAAQNRAHFLSGAQRLSASQRDSPLWRVGQLRSPMCSTPFGITERFTLDVGSSAIDAASAQRLSASQRDSPACGPACGTACGSAQRLSASQRDSPTSFSGIGSPSAACSTPFGITERFTKL